jgi:hypothetical protein
MNKNIINQLCTDGEISLETEVSIEFRIKDSSFRPGTVRIHLPAPVNASWLKEGRLIDSEPFFRMMSVEDFPQRSAYFNEILSENETFSIGYGFTSLHKYLKPDISLIDSVPQKTFEVEDIKRFMKLSHCGCESYTALAPDAVTIRDAAPSEGLTFKDEYYAFLSENGISVSRPMAENNACVSENKISETLPGASNRGTLARRIFDLIIDKYTPGPDETLSMAFVSMCRMCGIPARWQGGYASGDIVPAASGTETAETSLGNNNVYTGIAHDWCLIHLLPYGWIYADPEYAKNFGNDYFFGNIDPFMVPTATEPSANLYPAKDYERADKIFNVRGEAELIPGKMTGSGQYTGRGLSSDEFETTVRLRLV